MCPMSIPIASAHCSTEHRIGCSPRGENMLPPQHGPKLNRPRGRVGCGRHEDRVHEDDGRTQTNSLGLSRAITRAEMPRGVAVASIARLPSSTDDPRASGSTADRHEPVEDWGFTRGHVHGFQSMLIAKGEKVPSTLTPATLARYSTSLLRARHRCRANPKTRQRTN